MSKKLTLKEVNERVKDKNIEILEYIDCSKDAKAKCKLCGNEWITKGKVLLHLKCGCPKCGHKKAASKISISIEDFLKRFDNNIELVGEWKGTNFQTKFHCKICNSEFERYPNHLQKTGCPFCNVKINSETQLRQASITTSKDFRKKFESLRGEEYELLSDYKKMSEKLTIRCKTCGEVFETTARNCFNPGGQKPCICPVCQKVRYKKTSEDVDNLIKEKSIHFDLIGDYKGRSERIKLKCKRCNLIIEQMPYWLFREETVLLCPNCDKKVSNLSYGTRRIEEYLKKNNIEFSREYRFKDCRDKRKLPFDFAIISNGNVQGIIEYDGIQHFQAYDVGIYTEEKFKTIQEHDKIKTEYCNKNSIPLLRIPYTEKENIEKLLEKFLDTNVPNVDNT